MHSAQDIDLGQWKLTFSWCSISFLIFSWIRAPQNPWNHLLVFLLHIFVPSFPVHPQAASALHAPHPSISFRYSRLEYQGRYCKIIEMQGFFSKPGSN